MKLQYPLTTRETENNAMQVYHMKNLISGCQKEKQIYGKRNISTKSRIKEKNYQLETKFRIKKILSHFPRLQNTADNAKSAVVVVRSPGMLILYPESNKHLHSCWAYV
jgi:hypothetical protein